MRWPGSVRAGESWTSCGLFADQSPRGQLALGAHARAVPSREATVACERQGARSATPVHAAGSTSGKILLMEAVLDRFVDAQNRGGTYEGALAELTAGRKSSHWMWFVLPQVAGLGRSDTTRFFYALSGIDEARKYLEHPVLGPRLIEGVEALVSLPGSDPVAVMGGTDAQKLRSSMTLFVHAAGESERATFKAALDKYFKGAEDEATLSRI